MKLAQIARELELQCEGDGALEITGLAGLRDAGPHELAFVEGPRYLRELAESGAGAVLAPAGLQVGRSCLRSAAPYADFARAIELFLPLAREAPGLHPTAQLAPGASVAADAWVGAYAVIGAGARIGPRTRVHPHVVIYPGVSIGADCEIHSAVQLREGVRVGDRVVIQNGAVIGSTGFGFARRPDGSRVRVPHRSAVVIEDDAEIGANTTIDASHPGHARGADGSSATRIGRGAALDNLVQVGHGCAVGAGSTLCAQVGLAGGTRVGRAVFMAGQSASKGHIEIGDGSLIGGATAVTGDVPARSQILGAVPGIERRSWARIVAAWKRLPELLVRVRRLEERAAREGGELREQGGARGPG